MGRDFDQADPGQRAEQPRGGQRERQEHEIAAVRGEHLPLRDGQRGGNGHRGDHGIAVRFEKVGPHAGHVAHIVTHVVRNDPGIAGIVLGNTRFDFAHEVGADVRRLGENAAADAVKDGDERSAHGEAVDDVHIFLRGAEEDEKGPHPKQAHRSHGEPHDRSAEEGGGQGRPGAFVVGGEGRADVHIRRRIHANKAGHRGSRRAEKESQCLPRIFQREQTSDHHGKPADEQDFATHEDHGAVVDLTGNLGHAPLASRFKDDAAVGDKGNGQSGQAEQGNEERQVFHKMKKSRGA